MSSIRYELDGGTRFEFPERIRRPEHLTVELIPGGVVPPSEYQVQGYGPQSTGVTVVYPNAPTEGDLRITRYTPADRVTTFYSDLDVRAQALDNEFNNLLDLVADVVERSETLVDVLDPVRIDENPGAVIYIDPEDNELKWLTVGDLKLDGDSGPTMQELFDKAGEVPGLLEETEAARDAARGYRDEAEGFKDEAEAAASATVDEAEDLLQSFVDSAEGFKDEAEAARDLSETYRNEAEGFRDDTHQTIQQFEAGYTGFDEGWGYDFGRITTETTYFDRDFGGLN